MKTSIAKFLINEIMYSGHLQSLGASSIVFTAAWLLNAPLALGMLITPYLLFQAIYFHDRYQDLNKDFLTNPERSEHIGQYYTLIPKFIFLLLIFTIGVLFYLNKIWTIAFFVTVAFFGFLYPLYFKGITRYVSLFKNFYVASVFTILVFFPFIYNQQPIVYSNELVVLLIFAFIESFLLQVLLDMKDREGDARQALRTLPVLLGEKRTLWFLWLGNTLHVVAILFMRDLFSLSSEFILVVSVSFIFTLFALWQIARNEKKSFVIAASKYLLWPITLLVK